MGGTFPLRGGVSYRGLVFGGGGGGFYNGVGLVEKFHIKFLETASRYGLILVTVFLLLKLSFRNHDYHRLVQGFCVHLESK